MTVRRSLGVARARLRYRLHLWRSSVRAHSQGIRWKARVLRRVVVPPVPEVIWGDVKPDALPVIVCQWRRPERVPAIIAGLASQEDAPPLRLIFWNNSSDHDERYRAEMAGGAPASAIASIEYHQSSANIGGIARFVVLRGILQKRESRPFVMLDDDQDVSPSFVRDLLAAYAPRTFAGLWAFFIVGDYWARIPSGPEVPVSYVGTGGSVCDAGIVHERGFFARLPGRYGFIEDLWVSMFAGSRGWHLKKVDSPVAFVEVDADQHHSMIELKSEFYSYLIDRTRTGQPL